MIKYISIKKAINNRIYKKIHSLFTFHFSLFTKFYSPAPSIICKIKPKIPSAITTTIPQTKINITGSIILDERVMIVFNSSSYIFKTLSKEFERDAVSSPTLIITDTSEGSRSVSYCSVL